MFQTDFSGKKAIAVGRREMRGSESQEALEDSDRNGVPSENKSRADIRRPV